MREVSGHTGTWAWKHPHHDGATALSKLSGEVGFENMGFSYLTLKVLHDITLFTKSGQKIAFVSAAGAGKTTRKNLINRFYAISGGKIRYDGINIEKIHKPDLRHELE